MKNWYAIEKRTSTGKGQNKWNKVNAANKGKLQVKN